jgi:pimeloyl-ACP methyl ester carboxylesterase
MSHARVPGTLRERSRPPEELSITTFTNDLTSWIGPHESSPVVLGGTSMGAAIALRLAVLHPELIRALVLARPAWIDENAPPNMQPTP